MISVVRSELIRISRPTFLYGGTGLMVGFAALISVFIFTSASDGAQPSPGPGGQFATVADIAEPGGFLIGLSSVSSMVGIILLAMWAIAVATDYSTGLIRVLVQAHPNRLTLLGGKIVALLCFTGLATALVTLTVIFAARPLARLQGIETDAWHTDFWSELASGYFNFFIPAVVWGLIGLLIAVLTRSSAMAIAIGIGYMLVFESLLGIVASEIAPYLPGGTLNALAAGGSRDLSWGTALWLSSSYGALAAAVSLFVFRRRDITN